MTTKDMKKVGNEQVPAHLMGREGSGRGSEEIGLDDLSIPRIGIVQDLSPQRKKEKPEYIQGAEEGMMFNSVTKKLYSSLIAIPVYYRMEYFLWRPRKMGGGFRGVFPTREAAEAAMKASDEPVELIETAQQFCIVSDDGKEWEEAVISMSSSNSGPSRNWNSDIRLRCRPQNLDRFALMYTVRPVRKTNDKGDFFVFSIDYRGYVSDEATYRQAESVYNAIATGVKDVARDYEGEDDAPAGDEGVGF